MRVCKNSHGFTLIELIVAIALCAILGSTVAGFLQAGLNSYHHIRNNIDTEAQARTALSLITVQLRQHDATNAIQINSKDKILRLKDASPSSSGSVIWFAENTVYSAEVTDVTLPIDLIEQPSPIANAADLTIQEDVASNQMARNITVTVTYIEESGKQKSLSQTITQRSAPNFS